MGNSELEHSLEKFRKEYGCTPNAPSMFQYGQAVTCFFFLFIKLLHLKFKCELPVFPNLPPPSPLPSEGWWAGQDQWCRCQGARGDLEQTDLTSKALPPPPSTSVLISFPAWLKGTGLLRVTECGSIDTKTFQQEDTQRSDKIMRSKSSTLQQSTDKTVQLGSSHQ